MNVTGYRKKLRTIMFLLNEEQSNDTLGMSSSEKKKHNKRLKSLSSAATDCSHRVKLAKTQYLKNKKSRRLK